MKYEIGDLVEDEDGNSGIVVIKWDDGDLCALENDAAHPNPRVTSCPSKAKRKVTAPWYGKLYCRSRAWLNGL